jgi:phage protein U
MLAASLSAFDPSGHGVIVGIYVKLSIAMTVRGDMQRRGAPESLFRQLDLTRSDFRPRSSALKSFLFSLSNVRRAHCR